MGLNTQNLELLYCTDMCVWHTFVVIDCGVVSEQYALGAPDKNLLVFSVQMPRAGSGSCVFLLE